MLVLVNALVLLLAGSLLNNAFGFFAGWQDLAGALSGAPPPAPQVDVRGGSAQAAAAQVLGSAGQIDGAISVLPTGIGSGREFAFTVHGRESGVTAQVLIKLPRNYDARAERARRYPVLETFQGWPGTPGAFIDGLGISGPADHLATVHRLADLLVVSPQTSVPAGRDSECVNGSAGYPKLETWLTVDVPNWVLRHFRVRSDRSSWATMGLSSGGWCAAMAAMLHPDRYAAAVVFGGYFNPQFFGSYQPIAPGSIALDRYDLAGLARRAPPPVAIWLETSRLDPVSWESTAAFLTAVQAPMAVRTLILTKVGHRVSVWVAELPMALAWLGQTVPGFAPTIR